MAQSLGWEQFAGLEAVAKAAGDGVWEQVCELRRRLENARAERRALEQEVAEALASLERQGLVERVDED